MARVDKYLEEEGLETGKEAILSRVLKHQDMYDEVYMNNSVVDINNVLSNDDVDEYKSVEEEETPPEVEIYEEKSYSVNDYLEKAHLKVSPDNAKRDINNTEFKEQEDEIRRLIDNINEMQNDEDFFKDLKGDNEDTMIGAKLKTDEFNDIIYEALKEEKIIDENAILDHVKNENTVLDRAIGDDTLTYLEKKEDDKLDHTFEEILRADNRIRRKSKQLPIIIFSITLFILIVVILIVILK